MTQLSLSILVTFDTQNNLRSFVDFLVVEGDIYLMQSDLQVYRQATSSYNDEFTGLEEGFLPVNNHQQRNSQKVLPHITEKTIF